MIQLEHDLESFRRLESGWHFGEGDPISDSLIDRVKAFHASLPEDYAVESFPLPKGGVQLEYWNGDTEIEIEFFENKINVYHFDSEEKVQLELAIEDATETQARVQIKKIHEQTDE